EQPPKPASFGLGNARLQLLTEFFGAGEPVQKAGKVDPNGLTDTELTFGAMRLKRGKAFSLGDGQNPIPVSKSWMKVDGRTLLVEQLTLNSINAQLRHLPMASAQTTQSPMEAA